MSGVSISTKLWILTFICVYLIFLFRGMARSRIDLYDFFSLSVLAAFPGVVAFFPNLTTAVVRITGVQFPFVVLFGLLFVATFVLIYRLVVKVHQLERATRILTQELGLLGLESRKTSRGS